MTARPVKPRPDDSPWHTQAEAAHRARTSIDAVAAALRSGDLRGYQTGKGGRWRVHRDDIDAWVRGEIAEIVVPNLSRRGRAS